MTASHLQEAVDRAVTAELTALQERLKFDDPAGWELIRVAVVRAAMEGIRLGAVEVAAQAAEQGATTPLIPHFHFDMPSYDDEPPDGA